MAIVADIILLAIIIIGVVSGWKKGFVVTVMHTLSFFIAAILTKFLYGFVYDIAYPGFFLPKIKDLICDTVTKSANGSSIDSLLANKPEFFTNIINRFSSVDDVQKYVTSNPKADLNSVCEYIATPIASVVAKVVCFIAVFLVIVILLKLLTFVLDRICKLPILKSANKLLGVIAGLILGALFAWLTAEAFTLLLPKLSALYPDIFKPTTVDDSVLLKYLSLFNPFSFITKII